MLILPSYKSPQQPSRHVPRQRAQCPWGCLSFHTVSFLSPPESLLKRSAMQLEQRSWIIWCFSCYKHRYSDLDSTPTFSPLLLHSCHSFSLKKVSPFLLVGDRSICQWPLEPWQSVISLFGTPRHSALTVHLLNSPLCNLEVPMLHWSMGYMDIVSKDKRKEEQKL